MWLRDPNIAERVGRLDLNFSHHGFDRFGVSQKHLERFLQILGWFYRRYFTVTCIGTEQVPSSGRAMLVGNHSGGVAVDGAMVIASLFLELDPPRLAQGMAEKFLNRMPLTSPISAKCGQFVGLPENAMALLEADRLLMVFPEGAKGTAKLYGQRNTLVDFGTGFMRLAIRSRSPIIPFGFAGGGDAVPTVMNLYKLGKLLGMPYIPITPYLLPLPRPVPLCLIYGEPMLFEGTGDEDDEHIAELADQVKARVAELLERGTRTLAEKN